MSWETPDLSKEFHPVPKPEKKGKKSPKPLNRVGKRTAAWMDGQPKLKETFKDNGITSCEIALAGCKGNYLLGFAHVTRRVNYTVDELADPHHVVLACQHCHEIVDNAAKMPKDEAEILLEGIVQQRGW
jgi:hypothetical protein